MLQPVPFVSNSSLSPARTPNARRISNGTVTCPLLVIRACLFTTILPLPYFITLLLTFEENGFRKSNRRVNYLSWVDEAAAGVRESSCHSERSEESLCVLLQRRRDSSGQEQALGMTSRLEAFDLECVHEDKEKEGP